jgi:hypothetical protein
MKTLFIYAQSSGLEISADTKKPPSEIVWMPAGNHAISAGASNGGKWSGDVRVDAEAAGLIAESYRRVISAGRKSFVDFNHEDGAAAAWVTGFSWDPKRGIIASVEWTPAGAQALLDKSFYSFSPAFCVDEETGRPSSLAEGFSCGGLVNSPAFGAAMPALAAKDASNEPDAKLVEALAQIKTLTETLAGERAARVDAIVEPAVTAGLITKQAGDGLRIACKAAPENTAAILASIPVKAVGGAVVVSPGVGEAETITASGVASDSAYESYMRRLKNSRL